MQEQIQLHAAIFSHFYAILNHIKKSWPQQSNSSETQTRKSLSRDIKTIFMTYLIKKRYVVTQFIMAKLNHLIFKAGSPPSLAIKKGIAAPTEVARTKTVVVAKRFAFEGASLIITSKSLLGLSKLDEEIKKLGKDYYLP